MIAINETTRSLLRGLEEGGVTYVNDADSAGELARLDHQAGLVGKVTGLLPAFLEETDFTTVLDVGCGSGRWALDMAFRHRDAEVTAIDISPKMITYANARVHTQRLTNISFGIQDFLAHELPFAEHSFDLIHARFAMPWLKGYVHWLLFLTRCFVLLKPGGWVVITEGESIFTNSPALERFHEILCAAFFKMGYSLSGSPRTFGIVAQLGHLLHETGFRTVKTETNILDYSYYQEEANRAWRDSFHALMSEAAPFLLTSRVTTAEELAQIDQQVLIEMFQRGFCGIGPLFTFSAQKGERKP